MFIHYFCTNRIGVPLYFSVAKKFPLIDGTGEQVSSNNTCLPSQIGLVISTGVIKAVAARQQVKKKTSYVTIIAN